MEFTKILTDEEIDTIKSEIINLMTQRDILLNDRDPDWEELALCGDELTALRATLTEHYRVLGSVVTAKEFTTILTTIIKSIKKHVTDEKERELILRDIQDLRLK